MPYLRLVDLRTGSVLDFDAGEVRIGRDPQLELTISGTGAEVVSSHHARFIYRLRRWQKAAVGNMALYPASSSSKGEMWRKILGEVVLFNSFRKEHKDLWVQTWVFHGAILMIILGHPSIRDVILFPALRPES